MIVSAYPGAGKSTYAQRHPRTSYDYESGAFPKTNLQWYRDYAKGAIALEKMDPRKIVFVSSHEEVRRILMDSECAGRYWMVMPSLACKTALGERLEARYGHSGSEKDRLALENFRAHFEDQVREVASEAPKLRILWLSPEEPLITEQMMAHLTEMCKLPSYEWSEM